MATLGEIAGATAIAKPGALSGAGLNKVLAGSPISMVTILQGERVLAEHFYAWAQMAGPVTETLVLFFGATLAQVARDFHEPNIDTKETYDSISAGPEPGGPPMVFPMGTGHAIDVGPFTEYSKFQEWGFTHWISGAWIQNPFMIPAADVVEPLFQDAMEQLAEIALNRRFLSGGAAASSASEVLNSYRNYLYSYSKFAGDLQVFGIGGLSASRGAALRGARLLGDVDSGMRGAIGHRISRRITGRFAARGITASVTTTLRGPSQSSIGSSNRIYNRIRGQVYGKGLRGL